MPDQNVEIKITTTAQTQGAEQTAAALDKVGSAQAGVTKNATVGWLKAGSAATSFKKVLNSITQASPALGFALRAALSPVVAVLVAITASFKFLRGEIDKVNGALDLMGSAGAAKVGNLAQVMREMRLEATKADTTYLNVQKELDAQLDLRIAKIKATAAALKELNALLTGQEQVSTDAEKRAGISTQQKLLAGTLAEALAAGNGRTPEQVKARIADLPGVVSGLDSEIAAADKAAADLDPRGWKNIFVGTPTRWGAFHAAEAHAKDLRSKRARLDAEREGLTSADTLFGRADSIRGGISKTEGELAIGGVGFRGEVAGRTIAQARGIAGRAASGDVSWQEGQFLMRTANQATGVAHNLAGATALFNRSERDVALTADLLQRLVAIQERYAAAHANLLGRVQTLESRAISTRETK